MTWLVRLGWLTAAFSVAVIGWMLLPGDRLLPWVVSAPSTVYAVLVLVMGLLRAGFPGWFRGEIRLKHPGRLLVGAGIAVASVLVGVLVETAMTPYPSHPNGSPSIVNGHYVIELRNRQFVPVSRQVYLDTVESTQRGSVGVALLLNLVALMGLAHAADESRTPARNVRLPLLGEQRWPWVQPRS